MVENTQWEYHIEVLGSALRSPKPEMIAAALNEIGEAGWEVVCIHHPHNSNKVWVTMKRPLTASTRRQRSRDQEMW